MKEIKLKGANVTNESTVNKWLNLPFFYDKGLRV